MFYDNHVVKHPQKYHLQDKLIWHVVNNRLTLFTAGDE